MFIISYIHALFNELKCQEYIHKLRWKDRPFICPRCENDNIKDWGKYHRKNKKDIYVKTATEPLTT